ncbi:major Facilitator Superfamily protein [Orientia chuto str. Dubai]|uniref:Major Facilitator Superfamily protein n=1 Tax=Orientia chuto str. Dubai TaxID=1359168 RepID=A0A0F3MHX8_9RICK|nr:MFS transporter [Candidatus Orientia mediorientalis]KJV55062.1 major Facilitator Superfamily protein [Orientia chuto str. Dubai]
MEVMTKQHLKLQVWLLGFISGFTLLINSNTLNFWLASEGISKPNIGLFSIIFLPYSINFLWAPFLDSKKVIYLSSILGHRVSWLVIIQLLLAISVFTMGNLSPATELYKISIVAFIISFFCSTQNVVLGAIRSSIVQSNEQGLFSGTYIFGYRVAMIISGSGAIYCSTVISWKSIYHFFSLVIILFSILLVVFAKKFRCEESNEFQIKPEQLQVYNSLTSLTSFLTEITKPIGSFRTVLVLLIFLIFCRIPDNCIWTMLNSFFFELGFSTTEIAFAGKFLGTISAICGGLIASCIIHKITILNGLIYFGFLHAISHSCFIILDIFGKNLSILVIVNIFESLTGGMMMSCYIALISSLCKGYYRATQYSFLSSMMGISRIFPIISGYTIEIIGWRWFFVIITTNAMLAVLLAKFLAKILKTKV